MKKNVLLQPVLKWVGGKRQLLNQINLRIPKYKTYCEAFLGGGAVLFNLQPNKAIVNDINEDLINLYEVIKQDSDELIELLKTYKNESVFFYEMRGLDRDKDIFEKLTAVERAARMLYLNKTCYNGLFRVNSSGEFNTPFGNYKNPNFVNEVLINHMSNYFNKNDIQLLNQDYADILKQLKKGDFVYLDPPYDPISSSASFTGYDKGGFGKEEQKRLHAECMDLDSRGVNFLLSNSDTDFINGLYNDFIIEKVQAKRAINSVGTKRGAITEVLVRNYED